MLAGKEVWVGFHLFPGFFESQNGDVSYDKVKKPLTFRFWLGILDSINFQVWSFPGEDVAGYWTYLETLGNVGVLWGWWGDGHFKKISFETRMGNLSKNLFGVTVHVDDVLHLIAFPTNFDRADAAWMVLRAWRKEALNPGFFCWFPWEFHSIHVWHIYLHVVEFYGKCT